MENDPNAAKGITNADILCPEDAMALAQCKRAGVPQSEIGISRGRLAISNAGALKLAAYAESAKRGPQPTKPKVRLKKVRRTIRSVSDGSSY